MSVYSNKFYILSCFTYKTILVAYSFYFDRYININVHYTNSPFILKLKNRQKYYPVV